MEGFQLVFLVVICVLSWIINKKVVSEDSVPERLGMYISLFAVLLVSCIIVATGKPFFSLYASLCGITMGIGYAVGYCIFIFRGLRIGPSGLTVLFNNLGLVAPTLMGIFLFPREGQNLALVSAGIILIIAAMGGTVAKDKLDGGRLITKKWIGYAFAGWLFSCLCMGSNFLSSQLAPGEPLQLIFSTFMTSFLILFFVCLYKGSLKPARAELLGGGYNAGFQVVNVFLNVTLLEKLSPAVVFPVSIAVPIFVMLLLGAVLYKEKLTALKTASGAVGVAGIVLLVLSSSL